jgi:ABC-2 type transport system permease protein
VAAALDQFPTSADRAAALDAAGSSAAVLVMRGVPVGTSAGAIVSFRNLAFALVFAALMSTFAIVRHTRQNEETGRAELIGAGSVGRHALLGAALIVVLGANVSLGAALTGTLLASGLPAGGAVAFGAASVTTGMAFAGIATVAAQLFRSSRAANTCAATAVGVGYMLRGVGDALGDRAPGRVEVESAWPSWLSPIGWGMLARPFGTERWWVLLLPLALLGASLLAALALVSRRDLGAGLIEERIGPASAGRALRGPIGLAWRLNRAAVLGWVLGSVAFGVGIGSLGKAVSGALGSSEGASRAIEQLAGGSPTGLVDAYFAAMMNVYGALAAGFAVQTLVRLRADEAGGSAEAMLATAVSRYRWVGAQLALTVVGVTAILGFAGLATGLTDAAVGGDVGVAMLTAAGLAQVPGALTVGAFVVFVFGGLPRLVGALAWLGLVVSVGAGLFGDLFGLPEWIRDLSPMHHVPSMPAAAFHAGPLLALLAAAIGLAGSGMVLARRRDLTA